MDDTLRQKLVLLGNQWFSKLKQNWTPEELAEAYSLYNTFTGANKVDQGCGSCRRDVINFVRDKWLEATRITIPQ